LNEHTFIRDVKKSYLFRNCWW